MINRNGRNHLKSRINIKKSESRNQFANLVTLLFTFISVIVAITSLITSIESYKVAEIALKQSSSATEPLLNFKIDYWDDTMEINHETADIFQIYHINFGRAQAISIYDESNELYSTLILEDRLQSINLEHGHTEGTDTSDEDAEKYNRNLSLSLADVNTTNWAMHTNYTDFIEKIEEKVINICESSDKYTYMGISPYYDFRFLEVYYIDAYKNRSIQYYVYSYEYFYSWKFYKLDKDEYLKYVSNIIELNQNDHEEQRLIDLLFSNKNFQNIIGTKNELVDSNSPLYKRSGY